VFQKIADIPAVAPAVSITFLSLAVMCIICPATEPNAPPVAIIGPSAPNGPPVPIEIAEEIGFKNVIWFYPTFICQYLLHRFRYTMTTNSC